jgi:branched-chain amino acid transport system ATP-binding protein
VSATLTFERITAGYGTTRALFGVDLEVPAGRAVALLGANGAGKTTLLKVGAGILPPFSGEVLIDGRPVTRQTPHARAREGVCLIPEGHGIFRQLSVRENLAMFVGARSSKDAIERAASFFPVLGERLGQDAATLSGGQQQMLAVCRALCTDAQIILADELSLGLAPVIIDEIFVAIEALLAEGRSLLLVEQYAERALAIADVVYILSKGAVVFDGTPDQCIAEDVFARYVGSAAVA